MNVWSVFIFALSAAACTLAPEPAGLGTVVLALAPEVCEVYCVAEIRAEIYRDGESIFPLGPAAQATCGEELTFEALPAGTRVRLSVEAYGESGELRLEGASEPATVVADAQATVTIVVTAVAPPTITAVDPDPVVAAETDALVTISGTGMDGGLGSADAVLLDATALDVTWTPSLQVTVPRGAHAGDLVVQSCGIRSNAWPLRVVGASVGVAAVPQPPGCGGRRVAALAPSGDDVLVAFACDDDGDGYVERYRRGGACPLDGEAVWELEARPTALAAGWVGLAGGGLAAFDLDGDEVPTVVASAAVSALATAGDATYGIVGGALQRVDDALGGGLTTVATLDPGLTLMALAPTADALFVLVDSSGDERLVEVALPSENVAIRVVPGCDGPRALAASPTHVVIACDDGVVVWERASGNRKLLDDVGTAVVFDPLGDVALVWHPGEALALVDALAGERLYTWAAAPGADVDVVPVALGGWIVAPGDTMGGLAVWTPYDGGGPCP